MYSGLVLRAAAKAGYQVRVFHIHPQQDKKRNSISRALYRNTMRHLLARYSHGGLFLTNSGRESFLEGFKEQGQSFTTIHPAVNLDRFRGEISKIEARRVFNLPADATIILYVARFVPHKNHRLAVEIARKLANRSDLKFVLAGARGETFAEITRLAKDLDNLTIIADTEDVSRLMVASDIFLFPSSNEGFGIVALEALAAGMPVVATDLPAIREAIPETMHRFMFKSDDADAAINNLIHLVDDEDLRKNLSEYGKHWAGRFSIQQTADVLTDYYISLVMKHAVQRRDFLSGNAKE
jgi:glycosyltransferase involved in cell wall biosynthesis